MNVDRRRDRAIETRGLVKRYNDEVLAVDGIDLDIESNTIYSLLGPNGAGKTTSIRIMLEADMREQRLSLDKG